MKYTLVIPFLWLCSFLSGQASSQSSATFLIDSSVLYLNSDAMYRRPFLGNNNLPVSIGGYLDANTSYGATNGSKSGIGFAMPDLTLILSTRINKRTSFLTEVAYASITGKVQLRHAAIDARLHRLINLRTGLILNPIGAFNQNHDAPNYDFVDRPIAATTIIPAIFSNVGVGLFGKTGNSKWVLGYEAYLTNGFNDKIIDNTLGRTCLQEGVSSFENYSGKPMFTGKIALRNRYAGELGVSYLSGIYTEHDAPTTGKVAVLAVHYTGGFLRNRLLIKGEIAKVSVDVPTTYLQTYGNQQMGGFVDIIGTIAQTSIWGFDHARINIGARLEYADYNKSKFEETQGTIFEHSRAVVPCISFRPNAKSVIKFNYKYQEQIDFLGNPPLKTGSFQLGFSSYF